MNIRNDDIKEVLIEIPEGHKHIRTKIVLHDNTEFILQEATIASIVRAYITVRTHAQKTSVRLKGTEPANLKEGFANWQLLEENS